MYSDLVFVPDFSNDNKTLGAIEQNVKIGFSIQIIDMLLAYFNNINLKCIIPPNQNQIIKKDILRIFGNEKRFTIKKNLKNNSKSLIITTNIDLKTENNEVIYYQSYLKDDNFSNEKVICSNINSLFTIIETKLGRDI